MEDKKNEGEAKEEPIASTEPRKPQGGFWPSGVTRSAERRMDRMRQEMRKIPLPSERK